MRFHESLLEPYRPEQDGPWGAAEASHLLRRAVLGGSAAERDRLIDLGPAGAVESLTRLPEPEGAFRDELKLLEALSTLDDPRFARASWITRLLRDPHPFREVLTLFWHGHFATSLEKVERVSLMEQQVASLRSHGPGPLRALLLAVARDPAMVLWLDGNANRRHHPNENFARELFELFTLGEGHYDERDVTEAARAFSGWHTSGGRFRFTPGEHDGGEKSVLGVRGPLDGEDVIDACLARPACAEHVGSALFAAFIRPAPEPGLRAALGTRYRDLGFETAAFVRQLLGSRACFEPASRGALVRSPVSLAVGACRSLGVTLDTRALARVLDDLGQTLLAPPSVKGWDGGLAWFNVATLVARANLAVDLSRDGGRLDVRRPADARPLSDQRDELLGLLAGSAPPDWVRERLLQPGTTREALWASILSLPEVQLA